MKKGLIVSASLLATSPLMAQAQEAAGSSDSGYIAIAAALVLGVAAFGGTFAQGKIGAAAMDGISRNPQAQSNMFVSMILGLALIESLVILAFVISFILTGKI